MTVNDGLTAAGGLVVGDFNRHGLPDVAVAGTSSVAVLLAKSNGTFGSPTVLMTSINVSKLSSLPMAVGDVNGDTILDIAVSDDNVRLSSCLEMEAAAFRQRRRFFRPTWRRRW